MHTIIRQIAEGKKRFGKPDYATIHPALMAELKHEIEFMAKWGLLERKNGSTGVSKPVVISGVELREDELTPVSEVRLVRLTINK